MSRLRIQPRHPLAVLGVRGHRPAASGNLPPPAHRPSPRTLGTTVLWAVGGGSAWHWAGKGPRVVALRSETGLSRNIVMAQGVWGDHYREKRVSDGGHRTAPVPSHLSQLQMESWSPLADPSWPFCAEALAAGEGAARGPRGWLSPSCEGGSGGALALMLLPTTSVS